MLAFIVLVVLAMVFTKSFKALTAMIVVFVFGGFVSGCAMAFHGHPLFALAVILGIGYLAVRVIKHIYS